MSVPSLHNEWLSLMDVSGPFLAVPVLDQAFPQGLEELDTLKRRKLRQAYDEWREAKDLNDPELPAFHQAWLELVLKEGLELDEDGKGDVFKPASQLTDALKAELPEHGVTLRPDYAVVDDQKSDEPLMLVAVYDWTVDLNHPIKTDGWVSTPAERMVHLCRANDVRLGLVTNGEQWMFIDAPVGAVTTYASWYSRLWAQESVTLRAFVTLLGVRRFFVNETEQLPALLDESQKHQDEVTDALGEQVRRAVEVLIQALGRADIDRNHELLRDVEPSELYEAGLTVMMRIVFLLSAEERGLLLLGDECYESNYAVSTLRMQLRAESEEILERRWDAWSRLLAIFRAVYGGIEHEALRMPALGGSLFDPDRYPFLEGRAKGTSWKSEPATPLPIDNRTVLLLLDAVQLFQGRTLSYRALDVEQIGYVYEGLLERTAKRAPEPILDLDATQKSKKPWVTLGELESAKLDDRDALEKLLEERTGSSTNRIRTALEKSVDEDAADKLLTACHGDQSLRDRIKPYIHLLRMDSWGYPLVYPEGTYMVTTGLDRRETGTHYTPKSLTEAIVKETLEPVTYVGPSEGKPRNEWRLKSPAEIQDLKICDPAMGSGAFLVQVIRWMSERLVEAWALAEQDGKCVTSDGETVDELESREPLSTNAEERLTAARRLIAERCVYGVDINPLAVELAKLSIWLVTLAKGRPFGFLDHNLRSGDSLLGIQELEQLLYLDMNPTKGSSRKLFASKIDQAVEEAIKLRSKIRSRPIRDIRDIEVMANLDERARQQLDLPELIADALIGEVLAVSGKGVDTTVLSIEAGGAFEGDEGKISSLARRAHKALDTDLPVGKSKRRPFHWPLEFPEVFGRGNGGFDVIIGNPPFTGGQKITGAFGNCYRNFLIANIANGVKGAADLVAYFFLLSYRLLREDSCFGLLAVNTISEGDTRQVGLERLVGNGAVIYSAYPNEPWPGQAAVITSRVHIHKGKWSGRATLSGNDVDIVSAFLSSQDDWSLKRLAANTGLSFIGSYVLGMGFILEKDKANVLLDNSPNYEEILFPYLNGKDLNTHFKQKPSRWVINFWDWPEEKAKQYKDAYQILLEKVRPERKKIKDKIGREKWWLFLRPRPELYHAIGRGHSFIKHPAKWNPKKPPLERVLCITRVSKTVAFSFVPNNLIMSEAIVVFTIDSYAEFAILQSSIHTVFAWQHSSKLKHDLRYSPSDAFDTFPFPSNTDRSGLQRLGEMYHSLRAEVMRDEEIGLTKLYNRFHDQDETDARILELRDLHRQIDETVAQAYEWDDLPLNHGYHAVNYLPENDRVRFTISEPARIEALRRLSALNRKRFEAEQSAKSSIKDKKSLAERRVSSQTTHPSSKNSSQQSDLFHVGNETPVVSAKPIDPVEQVYEWIEDKRGNWISKQAILTGTGVDGSTFEKAISQLIADDDLEQQGEGDEARYRAKV